ncbi:sodium-translocating pyrophosphatase [candidate division WOR-3 bacterium]|nr:sodium-translocating pyrophosphatase [candidate division WOR-3 bacterium]
MEAILFLQSLVSFENTVDNLFWLAPAGAVVALLFAFIFFRSILKEEAGDKKMREIANHVRVGAMAYMKQQYKIVFVFFLFAFIFFAFLAFVLKVQSRWVPFAFLTGGFFSGLAGFIGMNTATLASSRTASKARDSLDGALKVAFRSGAVMGLTVVGLGLLDISLWFIVLRLFVGIKDLNEITVTMLSFGIGASSQALFARVGGGIFTKAADVGADLVGKVEQNIPEDDPRNPAVIADNVGDNVGDVAGMGADLYESYCGSILATAALGAAAGASLGHGQFLLVVAPMIVAGIGSFLSVLGIYLVKTKEGATQKQLLHSLSVGINTSSAFIALLSLAVIYLTLKTVLSGPSIASGFMGSIVGRWPGIWLSMLSGLFAGITIGKSTEYFTSSDFKPTQKIAKQALTGTATLIIEGIGSGMLSTVVPVLAVSSATLLSYWLSGGFHNASFGLYGIGFAAVGMLSTLGITLATDAYGPIADNAGGNAQMSGLPEEVRKRTNALDSLGNTTAATGKGFAIGSAALTALALIAAYVEEIRVSLLRAGQTVLELGHGTIETASATFSDFMNFYSVNLMNPVVLIGAFLGAMLPFAFSALTMKAVGRAAQAMVNEVRRQFSEKKGILEGTEKPDYASCIQISTKGAQREMIFPSLLAIITPVVTGFLLGIAGVIGLLVGSLITGFTLAIFMANAGGAWDNAKKFIEEGNFGGKGSDAHKAAVVGDTIGDPFKDTSGPSLNILIKLMSMVSVVVAGLIISFHLL